MAEDSGSRELVFISYSSRNGRIAQAIRSHLESLDVTCWMAPESLMPGEQWAEAISRAIPESRLMVLLWSVESMQSEQVINELTLADRSGVMILPFRVDDIEPEGAFKYYLYKTHWLDAFDDWKQKLDLLGERVVHNLGESSASISTPATVSSRQNTGRKNIGIGQIVSVGAASLAVAAALATILMPKLVRQPAVILGADESGDNQLAQCKITRNDNIMLNGLCRFRQFGGNGSFSLYPASTGVSLDGGISSLTLTVTSPGVGDVMGLVRNGKAESWGFARQERVDKACWKGNAFRMCIYAHADVVSDGAAIVFDPPSNIRTTPTGNILCSITSKGAIRIKGKQGEWYQTDHCGTTGFIHASQIRF